MRTLYMTLLALIMTSFGSAAPIDHRDYLEGLWSDRYSGLLLEIKTTRRGIKVRSRDGWRDRWRTFIHRGNGLYDDCDGQLILVHDYDRIEWRRGRRQRVLLARHQSFDRYRLGGFSRLDALDRFCGNWHCDERGISFSIERYGDGFRASFEGRTTYYDPFQGYYRDRRGNRCFLDGDQLIWLSEDGRRRLRFRRR